MPGITCGLVFKLVFIWFQIRIDRLVEKWSGSIEVGVTTHNPATLQFPATMTNMRSGTTMMSGNGILTNGKGTRREYGEFNLDELRVSIIFYKIYLLFLISLSILTNTFECV